MWITQCLLKKPNSQPLLGGCTPWRPFPRFAQPPYPLKCKAIHAVTALMGAVCGRLMRLRRRFSSAEASPRRTAKAVRYPLTLFAAWPKAIKERKPNRIGLFRPVKHQNRLNFEKGILECKTLNRLKIAYRANYRHNAHINTCIFVFVLLCFYMTGYPVIAELTRTIVRNTEMVCKKNNRRDAMKINHLEFRLRPKEVKNDNKEVYVCFNCSRT